MQGTGDFPAEKLPESSAVSGRSLSQFWAASLTSAALLMKLPSPAAKLLSDLIEVIYFEETKQEASGGSMGLVSRSASNFAGRLSVDTFAFWMTQMSQRHAIISLCSLILHCHALCNLPVKGTIRIAAVTFGSGFNLQCRLNQGGDDPWECRTSVRQPVRAPEGGP